MQSLPIPKENVKKRKSALAGRKIVTEETYSNV
jgi:hypothetical protein